jgi:uncharacterized SAM-binding protein YcdF (DUF218 family)
MRAEMPAQPRLVFILRVGTTLVALWCVCLALLDAYGMQDGTQPADVIVVLGARVYPGGRLGPSLTRRTRHAVALFRAGLAKAIVCSGGVGQDPPSEAEAACGLAETLGVPASALVLESQARSTEENALYTAALMRAHGWRTALISTDSFHLYRADLLFTRAGVVAYPSPAQITEGPMNPLERYLRECRELVALLWYWLKTALSLPITDPM